MIMMKFKRLAAVCTALLMALLCACSVSADSDSAPVSQQKAKDGELAVHFLDVGQGDSEFIELPGGETMLIDAGEQEYGKTVSDYISSLGYSEITYLVATHPHSDHIGGLPEVLDTFDVLNVYMPDADSSSAIYSSFLDKVDAEGCTVSQAAQSVSVIADGEVTAQFLAPCSPDPDDLNNASAVLKLTYGEVSFLFMGDAEEVSEQKITADVSADVVKVGHHGSDTSSSQGFVNRVSPQYAVIEVGAENAYGHPNADVVARWQNAGAQVLRTDLLGNIVIRSDGTAVSVADSSDAVSETTGEEDAAFTQMTGAAESGAQKDAQYTYVLNTSSKKIHMPNCSAVSSMADSNKEYTSESVSELEKKGYTPCGICDPE